MNRALRLSLALAICSPVGTAVASVQATRTWISGVGDDDNPCSRTEPCKTFAGAIAKTAAGGEISVLDPGAYGAVTITKSITLSGDGTLASLLVSGANAIDIDGDNAVVTLRNLSIVGANNTGLIGINLLNGAAVIIDRVTISGFATGVETTVGDAIIVDSTINANAGYGIHALGGSITIEGSTLTNNGVAVQSDGGAIIRLSNNSVYNNLTGFGCGGTLASAGDNRKGNNVGGTVPACAPNAAVTLQ
jgi:hypothetical protein